MAEYLEMPVLAGLMQAVELSLPGPASASKGTDCACSLTLGRS